MTPRCTALTATGRPCRASPAAGKALCRWHDDDPAAKAKHAAESKRGGLAKAYNALPAVAALADDPAVAALNLATAEGLTLYVAAHLHALARLPYDVRIAHAAASLVNAQRATIETGDLSTRLAKLEASQSPGPRLVQRG